MSLSDLPSSLPTVQLSPKPNSLCQSLIFSSPNPLSMRQSQSPCRDVASRRSIYHGRLCFPLPKHNGLAPRDTASNPSSAFENRNTIPTIL